MGLRPMWLPGLGRDFVWHDLLDIARFDVVAVSVCVPSERLRIPNFKLDVFPFLIQNIIDNCLIPKL